MQRRPRPAERRASAQKRGASLLGCALFLILGLPEAAANPEPSLVFSSRLQCQRRPTPGRVVCEAELEVETGVLAWADVLVLEAPEFAPPLRARVGSSALFMKTARRQRLQLALAATAEGVGTLKVRARGVHCPSADKRNCRPLVKEAEARVVVGPITE